MLWFDPCFQQNHLVGTPQVKLIFAIALIHQNLPTMAGKFTVKFFGDILADLITVLTDGWANSANHVFWQRSKFPAHSL